MTNREWLRSLSNKELEEWLCDEMYDDEYEHDCMFDEPRAEKQDIIYLRDFSSADVVEVKHGKWIKPHKYGNDDRVQCSVCLMEFEYIDGIGYLIDKELPNFCPNCGADMRIVTEGDNDEQ